MSDEHPFERLSRLHEERRAAEREQHREARGSSLPSSNVSQLSDARAQRYTASALEDELNAVSSAGEGTRNDTLNSSTFKLAGFVAAGLLDELPTRDALRDAALRAGLDASEVDKTIASAMRAGKEHPRELPASTYDETRTGKSFTADAPFGELDGGDIEPPSQSELDDFWSARPFLTHVHTFARARRAGPWAVLGVALARMVTLTDPTIVLPPIVGGQASLNLFVGLVGRSGSGKGAAERIAAEAIAYGEHIEQTTAGSGEGIAHAYVRRLKDGTIDQHTRSMLFSIPEIDTLAALGARQGATLMPELRRAWSGEQLGFQYVDPTKRLIVEAQGYRMCLVAGIQPGRAKWLLDEADGGTPQRFVFCSSIDPHAPDVAPTAPKPWHWQRPKIDHELRDPFGSGKIVMLVCELARKTIDDAALARQRGDVDALDGHLLLCQLKVAAALAIADSRLDVNDDDWQLADVIIRQSNATRADIVRSLESSYQKRNARNAENEATRVMIVDEKKGEASMARCSRAILRLLANGPMARRPLRKRIAARDRDAFDECAALLLTSGQIVESKGPKGGSIYELA